MLCHIEPIIRLTGPTDRIYLSDNLHLAPLVIEWYQKVSGVYKLSIHSIGVKNNRFYIEYHAADDVLKMLYANLLVDPDYEGKFPLLLGDIEYFVEGRVLKKKQSIVES